MKATLVTDPPIEIEGTPEEIMQIVELSNRNKPSLSQKEPPEKKIKRGRPPKKGKPKKSKIRKNWTGDEIDSLKKGHKDKLSFSELAQLTGHPEKAVRTRIIRMLNSGELKNE